MYKLADFRRKLKESLSDKFEVDGKWYKNEDVKEAKESVWRVGTPLGYTDELHINITMNDGTKLKVVR